LVATVKLPQGVTGFRSGKHALSVQETDLRTFRGHCYSAARALAGTVLGFAAPYSYSNNFAVGSLDVKPVPVAILLNAHFPLIGFAEPPAIGELALRFVDTPALVEMFRSFGVYQVLDRAALEQPLTPEAVAELAKAELAQFKYWRPKRVGDVIFNCWD
jgi:hypothetical protein